MTRKSCAVGMRNAIPRNYLKSLLEVKGLIGKLSYSSMYTTEDENEKRLDLFRVSNAILFGVQTQPQKLTVKYWGYSIKFCRVMCT